MNWKEKLKNRWKLESVKQVPFILLVFALTGTSVLKVSSWVYQYIPVDQIQIAWLKITLKVIIVLVLYQILLIIFGFLTGQSAFFINFVKRTIIRPFTKKTKNHDAE